ncbi:MAG: hypothetical protein EXQ80_04540 [Candidatus Nanopelagicaceae bacterium]|nr:hypothetical protein [Candidatus Nanopelagicaceae bacterium]
MAEELYIAGSCNIGTREIMRRRIVALSGVLFALIIASAVLSADSPESARWAVFVPLLVAAIGWIQSRRKFCLAYGLAGTFNFGRMGDIKRVNDPVSRNADRKTALTILLQSIGVAFAITLIFYFLPI